jgi:hypothetical protein
MYPHDELQPAPAAVAVGRGIGYLSVAFAGLVALWMIVVGGAPVAVPFVAYAVALPVALRSPSPVKRGVAIAVACLAGVACVGFLSIMMVFLTGDV